MEDTTFGILSLVSHPTKGTFNNATPGYMQFLSKVFLECLEGGDQDFWLSCIKSVIDNSRIMLSDPTNCTKYEDYMSLRWVHGGAL